MPLEVAAAGLLALAVLWVVLQPLVRPRAEAPTVLEPLEPEETATGVALTALKEIEFDRETGKLSSVDYEELKRKYTAAAVAAMRAEQSPDHEEVPDDVEAMIAAKIRLLRFATSSTSAGTPACKSCGPRPELDAIFCSTCGGRLVAPSACTSCGAALTPDSNFCKACGTRVAA